MDPAVAQIVSSGDPPETKLQKIYARVQQLRNTTYEAEKSGQEKEREKMKDIKTLKNSGRRLRRCRPTYLAVPGIAGRLASRLMACGFPIARTTSSSRRDGRQEIGCQCRSCEARRERSLFRSGRGVYALWGLPWTETGVPGLRMDKDGGTWVMTSLPDASASRIERKADPSGGGGDRQPRRRTDNDVYRTRGFAPAPGGAA